MDSNDLERERGITILSKCTSVFCGTGTGSNETHLINIVDTPGHADFGGEVERILSMVDGVALVVDATEGPMTQTRFVLSKALARGLKPLIVLNKADRPTSRPVQVEADLFDLFATLGASDEQMEYPVLYASAKQGWAVTELDKIPKQDPADATSSPALSAAGHEGMRPLFDAVLEHCPAPALARKEGLRSGCQIESGPYVGTLYLGRVHSGVLRPGDALIGIDPQGNRVGEGRVKKIYVRVGMERVERDEAELRRISPDSPAFRKIDPLPSTASKPFMLSETSCWMPSDFTVGEDGSVKSVSPYINNLHPTRHRNIYPIVEEIISGLVPLWEHVLGDINRKNGREPFGEPRPKKLPYDEEEREEFLDEFFGKARKTLPEANSYTGQLEARFSPLSLRGRNIQCIVKFANIHFTSEAPQYYGRSWHVEGMVNEHISASAIYYYDEQNIETKPAFRFVFRLASLDITTKAIRDAFRYCME
ncbi:hypothetical protein B0H14DRAFT_3892581 [Mycena olivaceomarginata]|nr:hypothetical protein B0H14DRAFT_3892581 [Mycena olivaceomarginata]